MPSGNQKATKKKNSYLRNSHSAPCGKELTEKAELQIKHKEVSAADCFHSNLKNYSFMYIFLNKQYCIKEPTNQTYKTKQTNQTTWDISLFEEIILLKPMEQLYLHHMALKELNVPWEGIYLVSQWNTRALRS